MPLPSQPRRRKRAPQPRKRQLPTRTVTMLRRPRRATKRMKKAVMLVTMIAPQRLTQMQKPPRLLTGVSKAGIVTTWTYRSRRS